MSLAYSSWGFYNPTNIIFGEGSFKLLSQFADYKRVILVSSKTFRSNGYIDQVVKILGDSLVYILDDIESNPDIKTLDTQLLSMRKVNADLIIALGGGSCIDTAKTLAFMLPKPKNLTLSRYFSEELISLDSSFIPVIAIPSTAGTGSEVTPFATVWDFALGKKHSIAGNNFYPNTAILDPVLTYELPENITIASALDVISHALESVWNKNANPITLAFATESLSIALPAIRQLKKSLNNHSARSAMLQASLLAGLAISKTRTALAHSISYPFTTDFGLPHGIACSFTLPAVMQFNLAVDDGRLQKLARNLGYKTPYELANDIKLLINELCVHDIFFRYVPDLKLSIDFVARMYDPMRADNNIRKASYENIFEIVSTSIDKL
jgi:phosphonate metabolism-associated iron-containing alcohol dehydrogenase